MDLLLVECFVKVAETGSVSKAAELLFKSQPAVSRQIIALEKELGYDLFKRNERPMTLTKEGELFLEGVKKSKIIMQETENRINAMKQGYIGEVNICTHPGQLFLSDLVPLVLAFQKQYPEILVRVEANYSAELNRRLNDRRCDCVYWRWEEYQDPNRSYLDFSSSRNGLLTLADHPLTKKDPAEISLNDFANDCIILLAEEFAPGLFRRMMRLCHESHFDPQILIAPDLDTSLLWVSMRRGIIAINSRSIIRDHSSFHYFYIPQFKSTNFSFIWKTDNDNPSLSVFLEFAEEYRKKHKNELTDSYL